jgi:predicted metal-dependent phosphoesterase TrpH
MSDFVDLHIHSNRSSDGDFSPAELLGMARTNGFAVISIADHDTVAAYPEAVLISEGSGVEVVPSMEVTTLFEGREFHVLLPFLEWDSPVVEKISARVTEGRWLEARERVEKLRALDIGIAWDEVEAGSRGTAPLGVKIAQILLDKPESRANQDFRKYYHHGSEPEPVPSRFYQDFFLEGKPACAKKHHIALLDVLDMAPGARAVPVLAHPGAYFQNTTAGDLAKLKARGLVGVEVYTSYHDERQTVYYTGLARTLDLVPTAGSDFHGRVKSHVAFGSVKDGRPWMVDELRTRRP